MLLEKNYQKYPVLNKKLSFLVYEQEKFHLQTVIDERREQTIIKDGKTIQDQTNFVSHKSTVGK